VKPGALLPARLREAWAGGERPARVLEQALAALEAAAEDDPAIFVHRVEAGAVLARARALDGRDRAALPLYGLPFAVKDNVDVAGAPTAAGCPSFAYRPERSAPVVERLEAAGAICVAKTNLDQFATGLVGTRSPYGAPRNPFDARYVPGGSSSGSAVALARGLVSFALGTDTAGSGRVPAAFNQVVGCKPTRGLLSCRGVVPAVRSLDCVSIFAPTAEDAEAVLAAGAAFDPADPFARRAPAAYAPDAPLRFGVFADLAGAVGTDAEAARIAELAAVRLEALGAERRAVDPAPFLEAAALLYGGPWVAERYAAVGEFLESAPADADPTVRAIVLAAKSRSAVEQHRASYRLAELRRRAEAAFADVDVLLLPTTPTIPTLAAVAADPVGVNEALGRTNNFANLFDLAAVAVPAGLRADGLPAGVTLFAPAFADPWLLPLAGALHRASGAPWGATGAPLPDPPPAPAAAAARIPLAVVGAHLRGQPLHGQLESLGARFVWEGTTAPRYRLYALANTSPPKPGLVRDPDAGAAIHVEVWSLTPEAFGRFVAGVPSPLCIGTVELVDGRSVHGFLCEPAALRGAREITSFGGWAAYSRAQKQPGPDPLAADPAPGSRRARD
jgi:allophanate hydrolase